MCVHVIPLYQLRTYILHCVTKDSIIMRTYLHTCVSMYCYIGATTVEAYFPKGSRWYDLFTDKIVSAAGGATMILDSPIDHIPVS